SAIAKPMRSAGAPRAAGCPSRNCGRPWRTITPCSTRSSAATSSLSALGLPRDRCGALRRPRAEHPRRLNPAREPAAETHGGVRPMALPRQESQGRLLTDGEPAAGAAEVSSADESHKERIDRELSELLQGLRVMVTGVQVLFAFLLAMPF